MSKQTTHIANAYSKEIRAKVTVDKEFIMSQDVGVNVGDSAKGTSGKLGWSKEGTYKYNYNLPGFVKIMPGSCLGFDISGSDGMVYVSIISETDIIADTFPVENNYSVIVDANGSVQNTKYGELWVDKYGNKHP